MITNNELALVFAICAVLLVFSGIASAILARFTDGPLGTILALAVGFGLMGGTIWVVGLL